MKCDSITRVAMISADDSFISGGASSERSSSGLLEWESVNDAMEALAMMNHYQMKNPSKCWIVVFHNAGELIEQKSHYSNYHSNLL